MVGIGDGGGRVNRSDFIVRVAQRAGVDARLVTRVYDAMIEEIIQVVSEGSRLTLTGFGKFYPQRHKGHRVQRVNEDGRLQGTDVPEIVDDYAVLKFSATRAVNRRLDPDLAVPQPEPAGGSADDPYGGTR